MPELPDDLRAALQTGLAGIAVDPLRRAVNQLIAAYRSGAVPKVPIVANSADAAAYAAYRMPATFSAVAAALAQVPSAVRPRSMLDLGGGTGAAAWAAAARFPDLGRVIVADQARHALDLGAALAREAAVAPIRAATWASWSLGAALPGSADLVTVSYVLGELSESDQARLLDAACGAATGAIVVVEPGTPAGYRRVLAARSWLVAAGWQLAAPCPHALACPLAAPDWCHFGVRVNRSALHRRLKEGDLSYEDEKFSYLVATHSAVDPRPARVLRRPAQRKGLVSLRLCRPDGIASEQIVTRRAGVQAYRSARDTAWGDGFDLPAG